MTYDLTGKRAIVTGASRGLGAAIARAFEDAGAEVFTPAQEEFDLSIPGAAFELMDDFCDGDSSLGLHVFVNCAGAIGPVGPASKADWVQWEKCIRINLLSPAELSRLAAQHMMRYSNAGSIINISGGGATSPRPNYSAYATAKCGLVRFSETLACEVEQYGIRVNCVAPGLLNTAMGSPEGDPPERAAQLVTWLASDASRPITGRLISAKWDDWEHPNFAQPFALGDDDYRLRRIVPCRDKSFGGIIK